MWFRDIASILFAWILLCNSAFAQTRVDGLISNGSVSVGNKTAADVKSVLDVKSTTKGALLPRMTTAQRDAITSPTTSLAIFNSTLGQYQYYNGTAWVTFGQALGAVSNPDESALVELSSTTKGFLPPRMTTVQRDAISTPATGLVIFNTTTNQLNAYNGSAWVAVGSGSGSGGIGTQFLTNRDWETDTSGWTASGGTYTRETSSPLQGVGSGSWDSSSAGQTLCSTATTVPDAAQLQAAIGSLRFMCASGTCTHLLQIVDGSSNVLAQSTIISSTTEAPRTSTPVVSLPSSGTVQLCIKSVASNEPNLLFDDGTFQTDPWNLVQSSSASFVGSAYFPTTASCIWQRTNAALGAFGTVSACPGPTVDANPGPGTILTTDSDLPQVTVSNLPPGTYRVLVTTPIISTGGTGSTLLAVSDGTTTNRPVFATNVTSSYESMVVEGYFIYTSAGSRTFALYGAQDSQTVNVDNSGANGRVTVFQIYRFPSASEQALRADQVSWRVDANISGANPSLGTSAVTSYTGIENGSLVMTQNARSASVQIGCSSTNAPSGLTCSAGNESVSVAFTPPVAGDYLACVSFGTSAQVNPNSESMRTFQIVETATNAQTITQYGETRITAQTLNALNAASIQTGDPLRVCGNFTFTSVSQKMLRLMYEQSVQGTVVSSVVFADGDTNNGQRDIHWEVYPINPWIQTPILVNSVVNPRNDITRLASAVVTPASAGSCTVDSEDGDWIDTTTPTAGGDCQINFITGTFSSAPRCFIAQVNSNPVTSNSYSTTIHSISSTALRFQTTYTASGSTTVLANTVPTHIMCMGPR